MKTREKIEAIVLAIVSAAIICGFVYADRRMRAVNEALHNREDHYITVDGGELSTVIEREIVFPF